jgi:hypothetical protein
MMDDECGAVGGMFNMGTEVLGENLLYPPQFPHDLNRATTRAAAVGSHELTV